MSLIVAVLLVGTLLTITVNERLGEIATLRAIGVSRGDDRAPGAGRGSGAHGARRRRSASCSGSSPRSTSTRSSPASPVCPRPSPSSCPAPDTLSLAARGAAGDRIARRALPGVARLPGPDRRDAPRGGDVTRAQPMLVARDLRKDYPMNGETVHALRGVSLTVEPGEYVAIVGPSGSGKSTLLQLLGGIDTPSAGSVEMLGTRLEPLSDRELTRLRLTRLGFVFQRFHLLPVLTARENVELPMAEAGVTGRRAPGARPRAARRTSASATATDHRATQLSGGEMQRVAIARALANRPAHPPRRRAHRRARRRDRPGDPRSLPPAQRRRHHARRRDPRRAPRRGGRPGRPHARRPDRRTSRGAASRPAACDHARSPSATSGSGRSARSSCCSASAIGVGVMVVLLSVGEAMLDQSRDVSLVGGGEVTVLPQGIDVEAMRTGGLGGMFFTIERARFLTRQVLGGPAARRHRAHGRARDRGQAALPLPRDGRVPTRPRCAPAARSRAAPPRSAPGSTCWRAAGRDSPADSAYVAPTAAAALRRAGPLPPPAQARLDLGRVALLQPGDRPGRVVVRHLPRRRRGEPDRSRRRWGGRMLVTHRRPDGRHDRYTADVPATRVAFDTARADLAIGESFVRQRDGEYRLRAAARGGGQERAARPRGAAGAQPLLPAGRAPRRRLPLGLRRPRARGDSATGRICVAGRCSASGGRPRVPRPQLGRLARRHLGVGRRPGASG